MGKFAPRLQMTDEELDAEEFDKRPAAWKRLEREAWRGLMEGDLDPLAAYIRSEYPVDRHLLLDLAAMIDGWDTLYRVECKKNRSGPTSHTEAWNAYLRVKQIGDYVDARAPAGSRRRKAAIADAIEHFGVGRTTVTDALKTYRRWKKEGSLNRTFAVQGWSGWIEGKEPGIYPGWRKKSAHPRK